MAMLIEIMVGANLIMLLMVQICLAAYLLGKSLK